MRHQLLKIASELPKGDKTRRAILAAVSRSEKSKFAKALAREWAPIILKLAPLEVRQKATYASDLEHIRALEIEMYDKSKAYWNAFSDIMIGEDDYEAEEMGDVVNMAMQELKKMGVVGRRAKA